MTKVLPIKIYPDPMLRVKGKRLSVDEIQSDEIQQLILDMEETMIAEEGIGLAATQVGKSIRLTVIRTEDGSVVLINPRILTRSLKKENEEEGCLSIPGVYGLVKRSIKIKVSSFDQSGKKIKFTAHGLFARVILHEVDHMNGILFIDRSKEITKGQEALANMKQDNEKTKN